MENRTENVEALDRDARRWASICHVIALTGLLGNGIGFVLGPLIVWLIKREDHPFIDEQGKEALNFQLTMFLAMLVSGILVLVVVGFVLLFVFGTIMTVVPIVAAIKASDGVHFRYPVSIKFIR